MIALKLYVTVLSFSWSDSQEMKLHDNVILSDL